MNAFTFPCLRTPSISIIAPNEPSTAVIILLNLNNKTIPLIHQVDFSLTTKRGMNLKIKSPFLNLMTSDWSSFSVSKIKNVSISDLTSPIYRKKNFRYAQQQHIKFFQYFVMQPDIKFEIVGGCGRRHGSFGKSSNKPSNDKILAHDK